MAPVLHLQSGIGGQGVFGGKFERVVTIAEGASPPEKTSLMLEWQI